jgi:hypothetical protein
MHAYRRGRNIERFSPMKHRQLSSLVLGALALIGLSALARPAQAQWQVDVSYAGDTGLAIASGSTTAASITNFNGNFGVLQGINPVNPLLNGLFNTASPTLSGLPIFNTTIGAFTQGTGKIASNLNNAIVTIQWTGPLPAPSANLTVACESGKQKLNVRTSEAGTAYQKVSAINFTISGPVFVLGTCYTEAPPFTPNLLNETVIDTRSFTIPINSGQLIFQLSCSQFASIGFGPRPAGSGVRAWNAIRLDIN